MPNVFDGAPDVKALRLTAVAAVVAWLPLLILSIVEKVAWGDAIPTPFVKDFLPYGQFLLAVPVLILAEGTIGRRLGLAVGELRRSEVLVSSDTPALDAILRRLAPLWQSRPTDLVILVVTLAGTAGSVWGVQEWLTGSWQQIDGELTLAGWWYVLISLPMIRFLAIRWVWRLLLWAWILWRVSRLTLQPRPMHPDRAGGLAFLGGTMAAFGLLAFAVSVQLACLIADEVQYQGANLMDFKLHVTVFVLTAVIVLILPLAVFIPRLTAARYRVLLALSGSGFDGAGHLGKDLAERAGIPDSSLPADDVSGMADFGTLYDNARFMVPMPMDMRHVGTLIGAAIVPFVPLVFFAMPAQEVFETVTKLLF